MSSQIETVAAPERGREVSADRWSVGLLVACLWGPILWRLREAWGADPELMHGVAVPFLALYLAWQRARVGERTGGRKVGTAWIGIVVLIVSLVGCWAMALVLEINALWPKAQWVGAGFATAGSLGVLYWSGGWPRVRHYAFPVLFMFTALSWPTFVRTAVVSVLTESHAEMAAEIVSLLGYPAVVRGNVIEVASGLVGVEQACAGLRSLQAVWMFGLFFGELHLLSVAGRLRVLAVVVIAALVGNVMRTVFLTWRIGVEGLHANEVWHDEAGMAVLIGTLVVAVVYAQWEAGRFTRSKAAAPIAATPGAWPRVWRPALLAVLLETLLVEVAVRHWYERGQDAVVTQRWELCDPSADWVAEAVHETTREILLCTSARQLQTSASSRTAALAAIFRWENDQTAASSLTNSHDPSVCMPAVGGGCSINPARWR